MFQKLTPFILCFISLVQVHCVFGSNRQAFSFCKIHSEKFLTLEQHPMKGSQQQQPVVSASAGLEDRGVRQSSTTWCKTGMELKVFFCCTSPQQMFYFCFLMRSVGNTFSILSQVETIAASARKLPCAHAGACCVRDTGVKEIRVIDLLCSRNDLLIAS